VHIPDGFLGGEAVALGATVAAGGLAVCTRRATAEARERDLPVAGLCAAFFLVGDAPLFPVGLGTQGHLLGGALAVALLGPWLGAICIAVVVAIQALALGDGGLSALGLNVANLALIPAFVGYPLILALRRLVPQTDRGLALACAVTAWMCVVLASVVFVAEFALGAAVAIDLRALGGATIGTYVLVGLVEAVVTGFIVRALLAVRPDLVRVAEPLRRRRAAAATAALRAQKGEA
jgi:cobalt/nickel transport system permease protein